MKITQRWGAVLSDSAQLSEVICHPNSLTAHIGPHIEHPNAPLQGDLHILTRGTNAQELLFRSLIN